MTKDICKEPCKLLQDACLIAGKVKELEKENKELKNVERMALYSKLSDQLAQAKDLIKNILRVTWGEGWNYSLDWKVKAEKFLKEIEK